MKINRPSESLLRTPVSQDILPSGKSTCFVVMCEVDYFSSLNAIGQQRYMDKLRLLESRLILGGQHLYTVANSINFVKDMSHWPPIEYACHIFCYFVDRPGVYTRQQMLQWKQLDAYNYFTSGFEIWRYSGPVAAHWESEEGE